MQPWAPITIFAFFPKERVGSIILIGFFCALILISRFQSVTDFPYLAPVTAEFSAQEENKSDPHKDRKPSAEHQSSVDDDDGHDTDRYPPSSYRYLLLRPHAKILATGEAIATDWISEPTVPPPRRL